MLQLGRVFPGEAVSHPKDCWVLGAAVVGALSQWDKGREKPQRALEFQQYLGICRVPQEGWAGEGGFSPGFTKT